MLWDTPWNIILSGGIHCGIITTLWNNLVYFESLWFFLQNRRISVVMFYPCLFCPSDNLSRTQRADATRCSTVIAPSWITQQISMSRKRKNLDLLRQNKLFLGVYHDAKNIFWNLEFEYLTNLQNNWNPPKESFSGFKETVWNEGRKYIMRLSL